MRKQVVARTWELLLALIVVCGLIGGLAAPAHAEDASQQSCVAAALAHPNNVGSVMHRPKKMEVNGVVAGTAADCKLLDG